MLALQKASAWCLGTGPLSVERSQGLSWQAREPQSHHSKEQTRDGFDSAKFLSSGTSKLGY